MASLVFYAAREDLIALFDFIFTETDCIVYEAYSLYDTELRTFASTEGLDHAYRLGDDPYGRGSATQIMLYSPTTRGCPVIKRIDLNPGAVPGHRFRYCVEGWGLIQLSLGGTHGRTVTDSWLAHNSEARARKWEDPYQDRFELADTWDWATLEKLSRKIQYHVRKRLAAGKHGSRPVLHTAKALCATGYDLR